MIHFLLSIPGGCACLKPPDRALSIAWNSKAASAELMLLLQLHCYVHRFGLENPSWGPHPKCSTRSQFTGFPYMLWKGFLEWRVLFFWFLTTRMLSGEYSETLLIFLVHKKTITHGIMEFPSERLLQIPTKSHERC